MTTVATSKDALAQAKIRMEKAVEDFRKDLASVRTGRANVGLLDGVRVDYHGTPMPINQLGTMNVPDPAMIVISPWDPGAVAPIDKAIRTADLGLNPTNDGKVVRVPIPPLTEERRKEFAKHIHKVLRTIAPPCAIFAATSKRRSRSSRRTRKSARTTRSARSTNSKSSPTPKRKKSRTSPQQKKKK